MVLARQASLQKLSVDQLKTIMEAIGVNPGSGATKELMSLVVAFCLALMATGVAAEAWEGAHSSAIRAPPTA